VTGAMVELASQRRCAWHRCRRPFRAQRACRRYCSDACRGKHHRDRRYAARLRACRVEPIGRVEAISLILKYERLGSVGGCHTFFGLRDPVGKLLGVCGFGYGPHGASTSCDVVLERGCCVPRAPHNSASFLISRALRYGRNRLGWRHVMAYSDERFGEAGIVYKAVGFRPAPPTKHPNRFRWGLVVGARTLSDRAIYRRYGSLAAARAARAQLVQLPLRVGWVWRAP
jgi:hypothetical protein